jgi:hypothetical protein
MGSIVVESHGEQWLVGNPKEPCAFAPEAPWQLPLREAVPLTAPLEVDDAPVETLARMLAERLVIERNGSVSERLWRLVTDGNAQSAQWLIDVPPAVWQIVRDTVLRCS